MTIQTGFDFGDDTAVAFSEDPAGTWRDPEFTAAQYAVIFALGAKSLSNLDPIARPLLAAALQVAQDECADLIKRCELDAAEAFSLHRVTYDAPDATLRAFAGLCIEGERSTANGITYKTRAGYTKRLEAFGMYLQDVGSLIVREWHDGSMAIDFTAGRDPFFLSHFADNMPRFRLAEATWRKSYCADTLANASKGIASVTPFFHNGRGYLNTGGMSHGDYSECDAWTYCALADWKGPTYNYHSQLQAWDEGRKARGDKRGMIVRIRGELCVFDSPATFYDDAVDRKARHAAIMAEAAADDAQDADSDEFGDIDAYAESEELTA